MQLSCHWTSATLWFVSHPRAAARWFPRATRSGNADLWYSFISPETGCGQNSPRFAIAPTSPF
jgi:hypothetical protein